MEEVNLHKLQLVLLLLFASLAINSCLPSEELDDGPYQRALRQAAAMADGWKGQSLLLHRLTKDLDPDIIPERRKRSITQDPGLKLQQLEHFEKGEFFNDYNLGQLDDNFTNYFSSISMQEKPELEVLTCVGDGSNSTINGYCKEESLCESFGGNAVGLCWKDSGATVTCCQPTPGRFFPIPYLYEPEVDMKILKRSSLDHGRKTRSPTETSSDDVIVERAGRLLDDMNQKVARYKGGYYRRGYRACAKYFHKRMNTTEDSLAKNYAYLKMYGAARAIMQKERCSAQEAMAIISNTQEGYEVLEKYCTPMPKCSTDEGYHSIDGSCNNLQYPLAGKANSPMIRLLKAHYADEMWEIPYGYQGKSLPHPRDITVKLFPGEGPHVQEWSMIVMQWGQYITHDLVRGPEIRQYPGANPIMCCDGNLNALLDRKDMHIGCLPIKVASDDPFYSEFKVGCLNLVRSLVTLDHDCRYTEAQHLNAPTHHLDMSHVYGNDKKTADSLRTFYGGTLLSKCCEGDYASRDLNPPDYPKCDFGQQLLPTVSKTCTNKDQKGCEFVAGDPRASENPALVTFHTMSMRSHNYCAKELARINPHWDDQKIYLECRRIAIAKYQYVNFHEYLPVLFGYKVLQRYSKALDPSTRGYTKFYNELIYPGILYEFGPTSFRAGHSQCIEDIWLVDEMTYNLEILNQTTKKVELKEEFNICSFCTSCKKQEQVIRGLVTQAVYDIDKFVEGSMVGHMFQSKDGDFGTDMLSIDFYRAREVGTPPYVKYLEHCRIANKPIRSWNDLLEFIPAENLAVLRQLYYDFKFLELMPAAFLEKHRKRSERDKDFMGPTFFCLLLESFLRIRVTDRFYFSEKDQPNPFTPAQLTEIYERGGLSNTICKVFPGIKQMVANAFLTPDKKFNPILSCDHPRLRSIDFSHWREHEPEKVSGGVCKFYERGKLYYGTCLPKELVVKYHQSQSQYNGADSCRSPALACGRGIKTILSAHIGYSEPTDRELAKFRQHTRAAVAIASKRVETDPYGLRWYVNYLEQKLHKDEASEEYILTEAHFATWEERELAIDSIKLQHARKTLLRYYADEKRPIKASSLVGVVWKDVETKACLKLRTCHWDHPYRVADGYCNYKANPLSGVTGHAEAIVTPAVSYSDGISKDPVAVFNEEMPNARHISLTAFKRESRLDNDLTLFTIYAVDFIRYSTVHQPILFKGRSPLDCCDGYGRFVEDPYDKPNPKPGCKPILIDKSDPFFSKKGITCLPVVRFLRGAPMGCSSQPNSPLNRATGFLVPELVYGSSVKGESRVRAWVDGLLRLETKPGDDQPVFSDDKRLKRKYASTILNKYAHLQPMAILWIREHNRVAKLLKRLYPKWNDQQLFHEAKAITIAQFQVIVLKEIVPALIGDYNVQVQRIGLNDINYNANAYCQTDRFGPATLTGAWTLSAVFVNMIKPIARRSEQKYSTFDDEEESSYLYPDEQYGPVYSLTKDMAANSKTVDLYVEKLINQYAEKFDNKVFEESVGVFEFKHNGYKAKIGNDLLANSIQASRIHGLASYSDLREACGFSPAHKFEDFADTIKDWKVLKTVYNHPKDVDGFVGIMLESPYPYNSYGRNSKLGGVGVCLLGKQVRDWTTKDRYFVGRKDNPRHFTDKQIQALFKRTMAGVLCDNTEYVSLDDGYHQEFPKNVFIWNSASNPVLGTCERHPTLDLSGWTGPPETKNSLSYDNQYKEGAGYKQDYSRPATESYTEEYPGKPSDYQDLSYSEDDEGYDEVEDDFAEENDDQDATEEYAEDYGEVDKRSARGQSSTKTDKASALDEELEMPTSEDPASQDMNIGLHGLQAP